MKKRMNNSILHLGSNEGNRLSHLQTAMELIERKIGRILSQSSIYETEAWGKKDQASFLNMVLQVETENDPHELLSLVSVIEEEVGRKRSQKWGSRIIDIDILFYENEIINDSNLTIPHPYIEKRNFVMVPLNEIKSDYIHPILNKKIDVLLKESKDTCKVKIWNET